MGTLRGVLATVCMLINTALLASILILMGLLRPLLPSKRLRHGFGGCMNRVLDQWVTLNNAWMRWLGVTQLEIQWDLAQPLQPKRWYLVIANHQAWADILILQQALLRQVPPIKFFVKRPLIWLPFAGIGMWLLDFPFLRRYGSAQLAANPALRQVDRQATQAACQKFRRHPTSVLNFAEGTRFTPAKQQTQAADFQHLLKPKIGGIGYALEALGDQLHQIIDLTIVYPDGIPNFWQFLCGRCPRVIIHVHSMAVPPALLAAAADLDGAGRETLQHWVNQRWQAKDALIHQLRTDHV